MDISCKPWIFPLVVLSYLHCGPHARLSSSLPSRAHPGQQEPPLQEGSPNPLAGAVEGHRLQLASAYFGAFQLPMGSGVWVVLSDQANHCDLINKNHPPQQVTTLAFILVKTLDPHASEPPTGSPTPGTYTILGPWDREPRTPGLYSSATFRVLNEGGLEVLPPDTTEAFSGTIHITTLDSHTCQGHLQLTFSKKTNTLSGSFAAQPCPILAVAQGSDP